MKCAVIKHGISDEFPSQGTYLDETLAATDLRALTARECVSSASAERMKPFSSVNTVTELDFLLTPRTWRGRDSEILQKSACKS